MLIIATLVLAGAAVIAAAMTWAVRHYALRHAILDVPNERSSHTAPTPRGGGIGIVAGVLTGLVAGRLLGWVEPALFNALIGGGILVAGVGFLDDHGHVPAWSRATVHLTAALWALYTLGGLPHLWLGTMIVALGWSGWVLGALAIVWASNLYNFMDGIDGIAGSEAVMVGATAALLAWFIGSTSIAFAAALIAAACAGFLAWNWAPARIFMGDVGSGFLGYVLAVVALASETTGGPPLLAWLILLGAFLVDATATLLRRMARRERWFAAHRSHAYQRAVQAGYSHARVTGGVLLLDVVLATLAFVVVLWPGRAPLVALCALGLLAAVYIGVEQIRPMCGSASEPAATRTD
ncbi:MAG: MraY family glycosyltransferase [Longimicrobiales bacterium]